MDGLRMVAAGGAIRRLLVNLGNATIIGAELWAIWRALKLAHLEVLWRLNLVSDLMKALQMILKADELHLQYNLIFQIRSLMNQL